jgi:hypothetical protein
MKQKQISYQDVLKSLHEPEKTIEMAKKNHFFVLTQDGNDLKRLHTPDNE